MIVSLDELKTVLGIALDDTDVDDDSLIRIIKAKTAWVEGVTQRRFDTPISHVQIERGLDECKIYLHWHIDDTVTTPPAAPVTVFRRPVMERYRAWEELLEGSDWERQGQVLYFLRAWQVWPWEDEFQITYPGGYITAPDDIKELILELASNQYLIDQTVIATTEGTAGLTSETIGDYSYGDSLGSTSSSSSGGRVGIDGISDNGMKTLNRYKRRFV